LNFTLKAANRGQPLYEDLREKIRAASLLHLDETSWRLDGEGAWLWYAGNRDVDFFHIDPSRSAEVILEILGDHFGGDIVSDDYAVYNLVLARWRQSCLAHIIRTAKDVATEIRLIADTPVYAADIRFAEAMADFFADVCALDRKRRAGKLPRKKARSLVPTLRKRLRALCTGRLLHPKTLNLRDRLLSDKRDGRKLFTFLTRPGMPPTNNHAERALRGPVLARKISFGSRSAIGAHAFAVLASLLGTAHRQQRSPIPFLFALLTADAATALSALYVDSS
jgi:transposase